MEYENHYHIRITSDYEEWELDSAILECFPDYEFTTELDRGRKEIRLQLYRYQSPLSTDGWGRRIENPLEETKYLIKKSNEEPERFNPEITVLFKNSEQYYHINIVKGVNKSTGENGFLLLNEFKTNKTESAEILQDRLYRTPHEAFHSGFHKIHDLVNDDFQEYREKKKKELRDQQKIPRKIVREFIKACNKSEIHDVVKNLDENIVFEKRTNWQTELRTEDIKAFEKYIESPNQELCGKDFKIRSSWNIKLPTITIGIKYYPIINNELSNTEQLKWVRFILKDNKIISITLTDQLFL